MALSESEELELLELEAQEGAQNPPQPIQAPKAENTPPKTDLDALQNVVGAVRHGEGTNVGKDTLQLLSAPFRGVRAAAVGAGRMIAGEGLQPSLERANEALSPEFKPETAAEKVANASSKIMEIAAPLMQAGRAVKVGRMATELGSLKGAKAAVAELKSGAGIDIEKAVEPLTKKYATPLINAMTNLRKTGAIKKLPLQDLHEAETQLRNLIDAEKVGGFARLMGKQPAGRLTDQGTALAIKAKDAIVKEQNFRIKGLETARQRVGDVASRNKVIRRLIYGALAAGGAKLLGNKLSGTVGQAAQEVSK